MTYQIRQKLGNYRLVRLLGNGGFAEVYLARHIYLQTQAAIKVLQIQLTAEALQNFLKEARIIANLEHPNIVRVLEFGIENARPYLVMNYAPNGTLRQRYPRGRALAPITVHKLIKQVVAGLEYAHAHKIIHRDIKPENMLLGANQTVLLSDFGLALEGHSAYYSQPTDKAGTMVYMAPEQFRGTPCAASDQYSLGIVAYEWLSGTLPFSGTGLAIAVQHAQNEPQPLHQRVPSLPIGISNVVMRALQKEPQQRYPQIQDFADAFTQACETHHELLRDYEASQSFPPENEPEASSADTIARLSLEESHIESTNTLFLDIQGEVSEQQLTNQPIAVFATRVLTQTNSEQAPLPEPSNTVTTSAKGIQKKRFQHKRLLSYGVSGLLLCLGGFWGIQHQETRSSTQPLSMHLSQAVTTVVLTHNKTAGKPKGKKNRPIPPQTNIQEQVQITPKISIIPTPQSTFGSVNEPTLTPLPVIKPTAIPTIAPTATPKATATPSVETGQGLGQLNVSIGSVPSIVQNGSRVSVQIITNRGNCQVSLQVIYSNASQTFKSPSIATDSSGNATLNWDVSVSTPSVGKYTLASLIVSASDSQGHTALSIPTIVQVI